MFVINSSLLNNILTLSKLLSSQQKLEILKLGIFIIISGVFDLVLLFSIANINQILSFVNYYFGSFNTSSSKLILFILIFAIILSISFALATLLVYRINSISATIGVSIANRLFESYAQTDWEQFVTTKVAGSLSKLMFECQRVTNSVLIPLLNFLSKVITLCFIFFFLAQENPLLTSIAMGSFIIFYGVIIFQTRSVLVKNSLIITEEQQNRYRIISDAFRAFKELRVFKALDLLANDFERCGDKFSRSQAINNSVAQVPRYLFEQSIIFTLLCTGFFLGTSDKLSDFISMESLMAIGIAALKLLGTVQQVYVAYSTQKGNSSALTTVFDVWNELGCTKKTIDSPEVSVTADNLLIFESLEFSEVRFRYRTGDEDVISEINLKICEGDILAILGESGSGKTTITDLMLGLIAPSSGTIRLNGENLSGTNTLSSWLNLVGYVPQAPEFISGSLRENLSIGRNLADIDESQLEFFLDALNLRGLIASLPGGLDFEIADSGANFSGGQLQRLALVRALLFKPQVLILDEVSSALDETNANRVFEMLKQLPYLKAIVFVTHRRNELIFSSQILDLTNSGGSIG